MKDIAKKSHTMYLLDKYQLHPSKKYGQNFIIDTNIIHKIISSTNIDQETCVIEIGPGIGALTEQLSYKAGKVICFEIDQRLKDVLSESLEGLDNVDVIFQDFLTVNLQEIVEECGYKKISIVANLPYYITSQIIEHILTSGVMFHSLYMMVQKEVAVKFVDTTYHSPLSLLIQSMGQLSIEMTIPSTVFYPSPHIESAILSLKLEHEYNPDLMKILQISFQQKRKTIYNNLKNLFQEKTKDILQECHIQEQLRPEQLSLEQYRKLTHYL